ncbi:hypothetical protein U9M48_013812 [Paspalum notatum var. saurae]|uniref:Uncharacterized protein n=1 Tax=Paspalum notatum var. saurae TaxID=547442 RepID=A0AAQ3T2R5_PASNO
MENKMTNIPSPSFLLAYLGVTARAPGRRRGSLPARAPGRRCAAAPSPRKPQPALPRPPRGSPVPAVPRPSRARRGTAALPVPRPPRVAPSCSRVSSFTLADSEPGESSSAGGHFAFGLRYSRRAVTALATVRQESESRNRNSGRTDDSSLPRPFSKGAGYPWSPPSPGIVGCRPPSLGSLDGVHAAREPRCRTRGEGR